MKRDKCSGVSPASLHGMMQDRLIVLPPRMTPPIFLELLRQMDNVATGRHDGHFGSDLARLIPALRRYARSLTRESDAAEDLVQDTLAKSWSARAQFQRGTYLRAWTFTILKRLFLSQRRRDRFHGDYDEASADRALAIPESQTEALHLTDVWRALNALPLTQRLALMMIAMDGLSYEQAADRLDISLAAFKSRVSRARSALTALLDEEPRALLPQPAASNAQRKSAEPTLRNAYANAKAAGRPLWIG